MTRPPLTPGPDVVGPDYLLNKVRELAGDIDAESDDYAAVELARAFFDLDDWLMKGKPKPKDWK